MLVLPFKSDKDLSEFFTCHNVKKCEHCGEFYLENEHLTSEMDNNETEFCSCECKLAWEESHADEFGYAHVSDPFNGKVYFVKKEKAIRVNVFIRDMWRERVVEARKDITEGMFSYKDKLYFDPMGKSKLYKTIARSKLLVNKKNNRENTQRSS